MAKASKVPPTLKVGLRPIKVGLIQSRDEAVRDLQRQLAFRQREIDGKLHTLLEQHGVTPGPWQWYELSLALAQKVYLIGFSETKTKGQPSKWDDFARAMLAGEMLLEREAGARSDRQAAKLLSKREPWKSFLTTSNWRKPRQQGADPAAPLLQQYKMLSVRDRAIGEDAYHGCLHASAVGKWERLVAMLLEKPVG